MKLGKMETVIGAAKKTNRGQARERCNQLQTLQPLAICNYSLYVDNKPLALRSHVTNASFKQLVGILQMPKTDRAHKNYLTPEI